jgi:hypothetical protein
VNVPTHWPALVPAIIRAGHTPVLVEPLQYDGPVTIKDLHSYRALVCNPGAPPVVVHGKDVP